MVVAVLLESLNPRRLVTVLLESLTRLVTVVLEATLRERMFSFDEHGVTFSRGRVAERQARASRLIMRRRKGDAQNPNCTAAKKGPNTRGGKAHPVGGHHLQRCEPRVEREPKLQQLRIEL